MRCKTCYRPYVYRGGYTYPDCKCASYTVTGQETEDYGIADVVETAFEIAEVVSEVYDYCSDDDD